MQLAWRMPWIRAGPCETCFSPTAAAGSVGGRRGGVEGTEPAPASHPKSTPQPVAGPTPGQTVTVKSCAAVKTAGSVFSSCSYIFF